MNTKFELKGYADSFPSESIQAHEAPGLAVSVVFPFKPKLSVLDIPVKQYKDTRRNKKAAKARELAAWLRSEKNDGLILAGFMLADTWESAAEFGLRLIPELPNTRVDSHYDSFRLHFGSESVDLPQAIALQYYFFAVQFGCLRTGLKLPEGHRNLVVLMDRFPHADTGAAKPGSMIPPTPGMRLLHYIEEKSCTGVGLRKENESIKLQVQIGNLNWWRRSKKHDWRKGKTHPHFKLPDWLNQAVMAETHYHEYVASFENQDQGREIAEALKELYAAFKDHDIWMMMPGTIQHLVPSEVNFAIPANAVKFVMDRAQSGTSP